MDLARYILRRAILSAFVVLGVTFLVFVVAQVVPSDPAALYAGPRPNAEQIEKARVTLNLDAPLPERFARFAVSMATGDFGVSYKSRRLIAQDLRVYLPATLELAVFSTLLALLIGIPAGVATAARQGSWTDRLGSVGSILAVAMPTFFFAMLLQMIFASWLGLLPLAGRLSREISISDPLPFATGFNLIAAMLAGRPQVFVDALWHLILPALTLAAYPAAGGGARQRHRRVRPRCPDPARCRPRGASDSTRAARPGHDHGRCCRGRQGRSPGGRRSRRRGAAHEGPARRQRGGRCR